MAATATTARVLHHVAVLRLRLPPVDEQAWILVLNHVECVHLLGAGGAKVAFVLLLLRAVNLLLPVLGLPLLSPEPLLV